MNDKFPITTTQKEKLVQQNNMGRIYDKVTEKYLGQLKNNNFSGTSAYMKYIDKKYRLFTNKNNTDKTDSFASDMANFIFYVLFLANLDDFNKDKINSLNIKIREYEQSDKWERMDGDNVVRLREEGYFLKKLLFMLGCAAGLQKKQQELAQEYSFVEKSQKYDTYLTFIKQCETLDPEHKDKTYPVFNRILDNCITQELIKLNDLAPLLDHDAQKKSAQSINSSLGIAPVGSHKPNVGSVGTPGTVFFNSKKHGNEQNEQNEQIANSFEVFKTRNII